MTRLRSTDRISHEHLEAAASHRPNHEKQRHTGRQKAKRIRRRRAQFRQEYLEACKTLGLEPSEPTDATKRVEQPLSTST